MKSSKLPGMISVKSKKGLDYMDMILKTTDLCKNFKGQMAVNKMCIRDSPSPQQVDERGIPALPTAKRLDGAEKRCSEGILQIGRASCRERV